MSRPESPITVRSSLHSVAHAMLALRDTALYGISKKLIEHQLATTHYKTEENVKAVNEALAIGQSVFLASDHPGTLATVSTAGIIPLLTNRQQSAVLIRENLFGKGVLKAAGQVVSDLFQKNHTEPIVVQTPKYTSDPLQRAEFNADSVKKTFNILKSKGGLVLSFATGTRNKIMPEAELGLERFSQRADLVVPLTTVTGRNKTTIIVHEPIPGKRGVNWCIEAFGKEDGRKAFSDMVMTIIASGQPDESKRGFYYPYCEAIVNYYWKGLATEDTRIQRMVQAYDAYMQGQFDPVLNQ